NRAVSSGSVGGAPISAPPKPRLCEYSRNSSEKGTGPRPRPPPAMPDLRLLNAVGEAPIPRLPLGFGIASALASVTKPEIRAAEPAAERMSLLVINALILYGIRITLIAAARYNERLVRSFCLIAIVYAIPACAQPVTYSEQIAPIIYNNCTKCHRP